MPWKSRQRKREAQQLRERREEQELGESSHGQKGSAEEGVGADRSEVNDSHLGETQGEEGVGRSVEEGVGGITVEVGETPGKEGTGRSVEEGGGGITVDINMNIGVCGGGSSASTSSDDNPFGFLEVDPDFVRKRSLTSQSTLLCTTD